jgi:hypothetical protein
LINGEAATNLAMALQLFGSLAWARIINRKVVSGDLLGRWYAVADRDGGRSPWQYLHHAQLIA